MPKTHTLTLKRTIQAPPAEVYRAFTHGTALRDWLCAVAQSEPRVGGGLHLRWDTGVWASGDFTALTPGKKIAFVWHHSREPEPSQIQIALAPKGAGTVVTLKKTVGSGKKWAEAARHAEANWASALENLQSVLETGVDLRAARRPRMGIFMGDLTPAAAEQLHLPATGGVKLDGVAEGSGAQAAGLQKDDVLTQLDGTRLKAFNDYNSVGAALHSKRAGDKLKVVFYRAGEKRTAMMTLSAPPPAPVWPATPAALAEAAQKVYAELCAELAALLEGVTEAQAEQRPAPNEWNAKELIAHFIACERDLQAWAADMLRDNIIYDDLEFRPNMTPRLAAIVARYPTVPALLDELRRAADETIALLGALPPEFVQWRKHLYHRLASWVMLVVPGHLREEHAAQLKATLVAVP